MAEQKQDQLKLSPPPPYAWGDLYSNGRLNIRPPL